MSERVCVCVCVCVSGFLFFINKTFELGNLIVLFLDFFFF